MAASVICPWTPSYALRRDREPKVIKAQFGDGYAQRVGIGINNAPASFSLRFDARTSAEVRDMEAFFASLGGVTPFYHSIPGESWTATEECFGVGDGTRTQFQIQRTALATKPVDSWSGDSTVYTVPRTNFAPWSEAPNTYGKSGAGTGTAPIVTNNYAIAPDGNATAGRVLSNRGAGTTTGDFSYLYTAINGLTAGSGVISLWMKSNNGNTQTIRIENGINGTGATLTVAGTWQRFTIPVTNDGTGDALYFVNRGDYTMVTANQDILVWGFQWENGTTATRYIPTTSAAVTVTPAYWPSTGDGFFPIKALDPATTLQVWRSDWQGNQLLYQTARTNQITYSEAPNNYSKVGAGTGTAPTVTTNYAAAPDGATTASRLQSNRGAGTTTGDFSYLYTGVPGLTAGPGVISLWMKSNTGSSQTVRIENGTTGTGATCTVTTSWQRFSIPVTDSGTSDALYFVNRGDYSSVTASQDIQIWGLQWEVGAFATSYIPTTTAAVTRTDYTYTASGLIALAVAPVTGAVMTFTAAGPERHQLVATKWSRGWDGPGRNSLQVDVVEDFS